MLKTCAWFSKKVRISQEDDIDDLAMGIIFCNFLVDFTKNESRFPISSNNNDVLQIVAVLKFINKIQDKKSQLFKLNYYCVVLL